MKTAKTNGRSARAPARSNGKAKRAKKRPKSTLDNLRLASLRVPEVTGAITTTLATDPAPLEMHTRTVPPGSKPLCEDPVSSFCPKCWANSFWVHPVGSAWVADRMASFMTEDQWLQAVDLLCAGYVIGFNAHYADAPDIACNLGQRCKDFTVASIYDMSDEVVYFVRTDGAGCMEASSDEHDEN